MPSEKMVAALNSHMKEEFYSGYRYLANAGHFESAGLKGFAEWFRIQAKEELEHALRFFDYLCEAGERVSLQAVPAPPDDAKMSLKEVFQAGLAHEKHVSAGIRALMAQAREEQDYATDVFLQWFVKEQMEEERIFSEALSMIGRGGEGHGVLFLDHRFGRR